MSKIELLMPRRTSPQKQISRSTSRFNIAAWGRQSGKTTFGINKMTYKPLQGRPGGIYWYVLQTSDAAEVAFNRHWKLLSQARTLLAKKPNESERIIPLVNGAQVFYKSGEVFENLRAETLDGCIIDEMRQQNPLLWPRVIRPMLARHAAWCDVYSTPNGYEHFYDLFEYAKLHPVEWSTFHAPSTEAWWWTPEEIESAKSTMSEAEFAQEILAEFRDLTAGRAYMAYSDNNLRDTSPFCYDGAQVSPFIPVVLGCDFNLSPMAWTMGQHRVQDFYWFDEIWLKNSNTQEATLELIHRLCKLRDDGRLRSNPQVVIAGDATSKAGQRAAAGKSDYDILCAMLQQAQITFENRTPDSNPTIKDRVNTVNAKLKAADGSVHCWVNPKTCPQLKRDLERVVWKIGANATLDQARDTTLTHSSDGVGYAMCTLAPLMGVNTVGSLRVILR